MRWRAEYLYRTGDTEPAVRQLELALRQPQLDFHTASKIQVRLDQLRREQERDDTRGRGRP